jgi:hypothetical protein
MLSFKEMGITDHSAPRVRQIDQSVAARPVGWDVFIAHFGSDKTTAEQPFNCLKAKGHRVFLDGRSLKPGDFGIWRSRALKTARMTVVLISHNYETAHYLRAEVVQAVD